MTDVVEMDAASNNSVEDIREIKEKVNFLPTLAKYRVYIIDEVHMLSTGAFNALLKTLEEPPEHVKFILATTEPQKLLPTILSRCQRFDFKKISNVDMVKRLKIVCEESNVQITDGALNLIATLSEGAARDALSILERCIQDGTANIDEDKIKDLVGIPKFIYVHNIIKSIIEKNIEHALQTVNEVLEEGKDLENFLWEMIKHTKDILMYKVSKKADLYNEEEIKRIAETAEKTSKEELINIVYKLSELENKMKQSSQKTIIFETEIIKLCMKPETEQVVKETPKPQVVEKPKVATLKKEETQKEEPQAIQARPLQTGEKMSEWPKVLGKFKEHGKVMLYANLINTEAVALDDLTVAIRFNGGLTAFGKSFLEKPENMSEITKEVSMVFGKTMHIKLEDAGTKAKPEKKTPAIKKETKATQETPEDILGDLDIEINYIEEE